MHGRFIWKVAVFMLLLIHPSGVFAQARHQGPPFRSNQPATKPRPDPREIRAARDKAVAVVGATGRDFVETYGEDAVAAIFACSQARAKQLVEFYSSGGQAKFPPRPRDLLRVIGKPHHGDDVASWAIAHADELTAVDNFDAYLLDPLSYALALKKLEDGAAEVREFRRRAQAYQTYMAERAARSPSGWRMLAFIVGMAAVVLLVRWRLRQHRAWDPTRG